MNIKNAGRRNFLRPAPAQGKAGGDGRTILQTIVPPPSTVSLS